MSKKSRKKRRHKQRQIKPVSKAAVSQTKPALSVPSGENPPFVKRLPRKHITAALSTVMLGALTLGVWFTAVPALEKQRALALQGELLAGIEQGGGTVVLNEAFAAGEADYYEGPATTDTLPGIFPAAVVTEDWQPEAEQGAGDSKQTEITGTGVLFIDSIGLKLPVTEGVSNTQLKIAVGHVPQTAPIGGRGNAVIAGHRSYTYGQFFNRLGEVSVGDTIRYQPQNGAAMTFKVFEILEVLPGDPAAFVQPGRMGEQHAELATSPEDENIITLLTCTPVRTATHRLLVRARLVH